MAGAGSVQLTLSFRGAYAVIHLLEFDDATGDAVSSLLRGDGIVPPDDGVVVPVMEDFAEFTGDFVLSVDRAWDVVRAFVQTREIPGAGEWHRL